MIGFGSGVVDALVIIAKFEFPRLSPEHMARNRGQSATDVADATRAAFHLTASAHPTKIKHQKMSEITFYKALARLHCHRCDFHHFSVS